MAGEQVERCRRAYLAVRDARAAWMRLPREAKDSDAGDALRAALCMAGDELARLACSGRADDGMTEQDRREAADDAARDCDFNI